MLSLESTPAEVMRVYSNKPSAEPGLFAPQLRDRPKYLPEWVIAELADRSSMAVVGYINSLSEAIPPHYCISHTSPKTPKRNNMSTTIPTQTAEERLGVILSNQFKRRMHRNRPEWYKSNPLDTAPKVFAPWRRNHVPLIRDWEMCHRVVAMKAAWLGKTFADKHYDINGVIWGWDDPASTFLVELFTGTMETVEFAISADSFWAPHIVVTHSPGDEPEYLDSHGNPDQLTDRPRRNDARDDTPIPEGYTPRQSYVGPTGQEQLFLPPRQHMFIERKDWAAQCAEAAVNRYRAIQKLSIQFHLGLERTRTGQQRLEGADANGRNTNLKTVTSLVGESDFVPMTDDEVTSGGWSDVDAASSLSCRGIMLQMSLTDLAEMADSAILSDEEQEEEPEPTSSSIAEGAYGVLCKLGMVYEVEEGGEEDEGEETDDEDEDEGEDESVSSASLPHSRTLAHDTYAALRRLGMVFDDDESDDDDKEDDTDDSENDSEDTDTDVQDSSISDFEADIPESVSASSQLEPPKLHPSNGSIDLASILIEELSSVSSFSEDQESVTSGCETPDTEDYNEC